MIKKLVFALFFTLSYSYAEVVNSVVATVNNEPITNYEISQLANKFDGNKQKAMDFLIGEKLKDAQIKLLGVTVSPYEVNKRVEEIASQNGYSLSDFKQMLSARGEKFEDIRKDIERNMKEEKLLGSVFAKVDQDVTPQKVKQFYDENPGYFTRYSSVTALRFYSKNIDTLNALRSGKTRAMTGVTSSKNTYSADKIDSRLSYIFSNIPLKTITPILPTDGGYEMFVVLQKSGQSQIPFAQCEKEALMALVKTKREQAMKEYFDRLRSKADVKFLAQ